MHNHRLFSLGLCLLLLCSLLAGCSPAPEPGTYPTVPPRDQAPAAENAPSGESPAAGEQGTAPDAAGETAAAPTPAPTEIRLSGGSFSSDQEELTAVVTAEDLPLLEGFTALKRADFRGSGCQRELADWALRHPEVSVRCEVRLADGTEVPADTRELDLTGRAQAENLLALVLLPELQSVELGSCDNAADSAMDWEALARAEAACPETEFH